MAVYGYKRVSTLSQEDGASLDQQEKKIRGLAMMLDQGEPTFFQDICSGSVDLSKRPDGKLMLDGLKAGDIVIAAKLDRLFRDVADATTMAKQFKAQGISLYLIDMGSDPVNRDGVGKLFFTILAAMADFERERIKERVIEGRVVKAAKGGHIGGSRPFGYEVIGKGKEAVLKPLAGEIEYVEEIVRRREAGESLRSISAWLATVGIKLSHVGVGNVRVREVLAA